MWKWILKLKSKEDMYMNVISSWKCTCVVSLFIIFFWLILSSGIYSQSLPWSHTSISSLVPCLFLCTSNFLVMSLSVSAIPHIVPTYIPVSLIRLEPSWNKNFDSPVYISSPAATKYLYAVYAREVFMNKLPSIRHTKQYARYFIIIWVYNVIV